MCTSRWFRDGRKEGNFENTFRLETFEANDLRFREEEKVVTRKGVVGEWHGKVCARVFDRTLRVFSRDPRIVSDKPLIQHTTVDFLK